MLDIAGGTVHQSRHC